MIIASIWLLFSCISIIRAFENAIVYDAIWWNSQIDSTSILGKQMINIYNTIAANEAIHQQKYQTALQLISGNSSEDYYNRGTIKTLVAYQDAMQNHMSWLQNAQVNIAQAQQDFDIAKKLTTSKVMKKNINKNQISANTLATVVDIKTCYSIGQNIVSNISELTDSIKSIQWVLDQEMESIDKQKNILGSSCYKKLQDIAMTSKQQVQSLASQIITKKKIYITDFSEKIKNPMTCIELPYEDILPSIERGKIWLKIYQQQHQNTIAVVKSNNAQSIKTLCEYVKNDAQINQNLENRLNELLEKLEDNTIENQIQKKSSSTTNYKDFFDKNQKQILNEIYEINYWRIETMLQIKSKWNYNPKEYIKDMFNEFYGNSGDFIDLHK